MSDTTILIPAYAAESFIDQTLHFARGQTYRDIEIVVSVDRHDDATAEKVAQHVRADPRVRMHVQSTRLGWAGNVNFLLDQVRTPFCFIYFHDDIITPNYVERLLPRIEQHPTASLIHCDVRYVGEHQSVLPARANERSKFERLMQFMLAPDRGAPLRGIMRRDVMGAVRLPDEGGQALYANEIFLMQATALGPVLAESEILYINWANRPQGLMAQWSKIGAQEARAGVRTITDKALSMLSEAAQTQSEREALSFAAFLWLKRFLDDAEARAGERLYRTPGDWLPSWRAAHWPPEFEGWSEDIANWARARWERAAPDILTRREA